MDQSLLEWRESSQSVMRGAHPLGIALLPLLQCHFLGLRHEHLIIAGCDIRQRLVSFVEQRGAMLTIDAVLPGLRRALAPEGVAHLLVAHNHPCGSLQASQADCEVTRRIAALARLAGVTLADHLLFTDARYTSFRALGLL
ncbi:hypothetical protein GV829_10860 [Sphingomonas lacunae]|uniref:RadC-like JAB domain-containing protein n=1 Tax=Sphingomonas lacunae TaxID=2698828 RepID=A0A6M4AWX8_9SPHN|nr:JAB domain-containing protein [Sphingomonas lacunae]QJQ32880.1 hypothetical protein GV829_10860 [Sphingomonas lacunae]